MSDAMTTPPNGSAAAGGTPTAAPSPSSSPEGGVPRSDYVGRIRHEPEFAEREVLNQQSRADRAEGELRKLRERIGSLDRYFQQEFTGDQLAQHLQDYEGLLGDDSMKQAILRFRETGVFNPPPRGQSDAGAQDDDDYLSPEEKQIRELKQQLAEVTNRVQTQESSVGRKALQEHLEGFYRNFPLDQGVQERVRGALTNHVKQLSQQGAEGQKTLRLLLSPEGAQTVRALALGALTEEEILQAAEKARLRKQQGLGQLGTDGPPQFSSQGMEPPPEFKDALDAFKWAKANPEKHDSL